MPRIRKPPAAPADDLKPVIITVEADPTEAITFEMTDGDTPSPVAPIEPEPSPRPRVVEEEPPGDDALQRALDAQKRAEDLLAAERHRANTEAQRASERETELQREREGRAGAEYNSVLTAIAAEQSTIDKAEADYAAAASAGDWQSTAKAQRELAIASARLDRLQDSKANLDTVRERQKTEPPPRHAEPSVEDRISRMPGEAQTWLRAHPEFVTDQGKNAKIGKTHNYLVDVKGVAAFSPEYFDALDAEFGFKKEPDTIQPETRPAPQRRSIPMTAPPSRDVPTASGKRATPQMTLTPEERIIARNSFTAADMTAEQKEYLYAQNKAKLHAMRANGQYHTTSEERG